MASSRTGAQNNGPWMQSVLSDSDTKTGGIRDLLGSEKMREC